jgi:hypothetical protein
MINLKNFRLLVRYSKTEEVFDFGCTAVLMYRILRNFFYEERECITYEPDG